MIALECVNLAKFAERIGEQWARTLAMGVSTGTSYWSSTSSARS